MLALGVNNFAWWKRIRIILNAPAKKSEQRKSDSITLFHFMKNRYLDDLTVGGGDGAEMLRRIKKAAIRVGRPGSEPKFLQELIEQDHCTTQPRRPRCHHRCMMDKISLPGHRCCLHSDTEAANRVVRISPETKTGRILLLNIRQTAHFSASIFEREHQPGRSKFRSVVRAVEKRGIQCCKVSSSSFRQNDRVLLWRNNTMRVPNAPYLKPETYLLFSIYYRALTVGNRKLSAKSFFERFQKQIQAMGHVLEWLDLAYPNRNNSLGWTPSHIMIDLIVQPHRRRLKSRKESPSAQDEDTFDTLIEEALANVENDSSVRKDVISVLGVLGLVAYVGNGQGVPTNLLRELVAKRRRRERLWREADSICPEGL
jgi:hypothetical protein